MIKFAFALTLCVILNPFLAKAQIEVRSGEHGDFTRLVFYLESPVESWTIERISNGIKITPPSDLLGEKFDLSSIFDFIPKVRITAVTQTSTALEVISNCDCKMNAFAHSENILVLDISDSRDSDSPQYTGLIRNDPVSKDTHAPKQKVRNSSVFMGYIAPKPTPSLVNFNPRETSEVLSDNPEIYRAISENIASGILSPAPPETTFGATSLLEDGIVFSNALDTGPVVSALKTEPDHICPATNLLDLKAASMQTSELVAALTNAKGRLALEVNHPTNKAVLDLVKAYLFLGFGAEAKMLLSAFPIEEQGARLLASIGDIIDFPGAPNADYPVELITCPGMASFWAFLAATPPQLTRYDIDTKGLLRTLSGLPVILRSHLAPYVSDKFSDIERPEEASIALAAARRASDAPKLQTEVKVSKVSVTPQTTASDLASKNVPQTRWQGDLSKEHFGETVLNAITRSPLDLSDRILIEAAIKDAPNQESRIEAITLYTQNLSKNNKATIALSYLDQLLSETKSHKDTLLPILDGALLSIARTATRGEVLAVSASLHDRSWFTTTYGSGKEEFLARVAEVKQEFGLSANSAINGSEALSADLLNTSTEDEPLTEDGTSVADAPETQSATNSGLNDLLAKGERSLAEADAISERMDALLSNW